MKQVLDVGQCQMDHGAIRRLIEGKFSARVTQSHTAAETLEHLRREKFDLVLINRKLDADHSDGLDIIKQIKADPDLAETSVMLVSNYPEYQEQAVAAGAEPGFGKSSYNTAETQTLLSSVLG